MKMVRVVVVGLCVCVALVGAASVNNDGEYNYSIAKNHKMVLDRMESVKIIFCNFFRSFRISKCNRKRM